MARSTKIVTPSSAIGGVVGWNGAIGAHSLTDNANVDLLQIVVPAFTQNTTTAAYVGPVTVPGFLFGAYFSAHVPPIAAGGTLSVNVLVSQAGVAFALLATLDPQTAVADIGLALALQALNDTTVLAAADTIEVTTVASNNAIGTAMVGGVLTLMFRRIEPVKAQFGGQSLITGTGAGL